MQDSSQRHHSKVQSEQKTRRAKKFNIAKITAKDLSNPPYVDQPEALNYSKSDIKTGGKDLQICHDDDQVLFSKDTILIENLLKIRKNKAQNSRSVLKQHSNLHISEELNLRKSCQHGLVDPSPYKINSLRNSHEVRSVKTRNVHNGLTPKMTVSSLDTRRKPTVRQHTSMKEKNKANDSLPDISVNKHIHSLNFDCKPKRGSCRPVNQMSSVDDREGESLLNTHKKQLGNLRSNNIYNVMNTRNNLKLLENNEGILRTKSYNKCSKNNTKHLVIHSDFSEIDNYLLGNSQEYRGKNYIL